MTINLDELSVAITDYILAAFVLYWSYGFFKSKKIDPRVKRYALLFFLVGLSAMIGGTYHLLHHAIPDTYSSFLWKVTQLFIASAALMLLNIFLGEFQNILEEKVRLIIMVVVALGFSLVMFAFDAFIVCILIYLFIMLGMIFVSAKRMKYSQSSYYKYLLIGFSVSVFAAIVQMSGFSVHRFLTHNDLYHLLQLLGLYFIQGAVRSIEN